MSNPIIFKQYLKLINAVLNVNTARPDIKSWRDLSLILFTMNTDTAMGQCALLAEAFEYATHPYHPRIPVSSIRWYINLNLSEHVLSELGYSKGTDYIKDDQNLRISFATLRKLIFTNGKNGADDAFNLIDRFYQVYMRHQSQGGRKTHWALIERVGNLVQSLQPHIKSERSKSDFTCMDEQPKVYEIVKGTRKSLEAKLVRLNKQANDPDNPVIKYAGHYITPIYESIQTNINDDIKYLFAHLNEEVLKPYKKAQEDKLKKLCIKIVRNCILIDESQNFYTTEMLLDSINLVRTNIKLGRAQDGFEREMPKFYNSQSNSRKQFIEGNFTNIEIFMRSNCKEIDDRCLIKLNQHIEDFTTLLHSQEESEYDEGSDMDWESDAEEEEEEEEEEVSIPKTKPRTTRNSTKGRLFESPNEIYEIPTNQVVADETSPQPFTNKIDYNTEDEFEDI